MAAPNGAAFFMLTFHDKKMNFFFLFQGPERIILLRVFNMNDTRMCLAYRMMTRHIKGIPSFATPGKSIPIVF